MIGAFVSLLSNDHNGTTALSACLTQPSYEKVSVYHQLLGVLIEPKNRVCVSRPLNQTLKIPWISVYYSLDVLLKRLLLFGSDFVIRSKGVSIHYIYLRKVENSCRLDFLYQ